MVKSDYKYISGDYLIKKLSKYYNLEIASQRGSHVKVIVSGKKLLFQSIRNLLTKFSLEY